MTVERGATWGTSGPLDADGVLVRTNGELRGVVSAARRSGSAVPMIGLLGGDLCRTLGGSGNETRIRSQDGRRLPIDVGAALVDGRLHWFVAHLVARRSWWRGRLLAVMNAEHIGRWDVAPRAHPNDGLLDVLDADLPFGQRLQARRRLHLGTHVPHPDIRQERTAAFQADLDPVGAVWLDGERVATGAHQLSIRVETDAVTVVV